MTRIKLRRGDVACLGRLIKGPLEIGAIPGETVERLVDQGLVVQVLGSCEITGSGQLTYHRQQFLRAPRLRAASGGLSTSLYLQHTRRGSRLRGVHAMRRRIDARIRQASELPHWLMKIASETAGQIRSIHLNTANWRGVILKKITKPIEEFRRHAGFGEFSLLCNSVRVLSFGAISQIALTLRSGVSRVSKGVISASRVSILRDGQKPSSG